MNIKRILFFIMILVVVVAAFLVYSTILEDMKENETPNPRALWDFKTVKSTTIDPTSLLGDIRNGKKITLHVQDFEPDNPSFTPIGWSENDFLEVAQTYWKAIWQDDPNLWNLYKVVFDTTCDSASDQFGDAEFLYYQEITKDGVNLYSVRGFDIYPAYGYLSWSGDTIYPRPKLGRKLIKIDLENIIKVPAEKALALADQQGGSDFRKKENNNCNITIILWPEQYERSDWLVLYTGKTNTEIWIPAK